MEVRLSHVRRRANCGFKNLAAGALLPQRPAKLRIRFNKDSIPALLFKKIGQTVGSRLVCSHFNEKPVVSLSEVFPDEFALPVFRSWWHILKFYSDGKFFANLASVGQSVGAGGGGNKRELPPPAGDAKISCQRENRN